MSRRLLVIERNTGSFESSLAALGPSSASGLEFDCSPWFPDPRERIASCRADLILPVAIPHSVEALDFLRSLRDHPIPKPTLAVLSDQAGEDLLRAAAEAADDFILWPVHRLELRQRVCRILGPELHSEALVHGKLLEAHGLAKLVGADPAFRRTIEKIPIAARSGSPVLITGETGTGKELCARAIHHLSPRSSFPFIPVDCGALPDHLLENELFGHSRGAFTDARTDQKGLVALAEGGTLFIDEVDSLSLSGQAKLLRFLQEKTYRPLGADRFRHANVTVLAAVNQDPERLVAQHRLRSDLYFRLNVLRLYLPPLRERRDDIALLARHFVESLCAETNAGRKTLTPTAIRKLSHHDWPGNARELRNVIQRAILFSEGSQILPGHVLTSEPVFDPVADVAGGDFRGARSQAVAAFEKDYVEDALRKHGGNVTRAAREAGKDRRAFGRLVKKYRIERLDL
jgi:two-component system, NtrC family, response regulator GlrR